MTQTLKIHHYLGEPPTEMFVPVSAYYGGDDPDDWGSVGFTHCCTTQVEVPDCWPVGDALVKFS